MSENLYPLPPRFETVAVEAPQGIYRYFILDRRGMNTICEVFSPDDADLLCAGMNACPEKVPDRMIAVTTHAYRG